MARECSLIVCSEKHYAMGFCRAHYRRLLKYGDPLLGGIPYKKGQGHIDNHGYRKVWRPDHPNANSAGYVLEHRLVMSEYLGRPLRASEQVHHVNGDRLDNRLENLELWTTQQPSGQRVSDLLSWAREVVEIYEGYENPDAAAA